jgi:hypothetical protein
MTMANALIINLGGGDISLGRLVVGPGQSDSHVLLRIEGGFAPAFGHFREAALSRQQEEELLQFLWERANPPLPPSDIEGEQRLLGAVLTKPALFEVLADQVTSEHFADPVHRAIWCAMHQLALNTVEPTPDAVSIQMHGSGILDEVGGPAYLQQLTKQMPLRAADAVLLARRIEEMGIDRQGGETPPWEATR